MKYEPGRLVGRGWFKSPREGPGEAGGGADEEFPIFAPRRVWIGPSNFAQSVVLTSLPKVDSVVEKRSDGIIDTKQAAL
jgi:hypothetical protein